MRAWMPWVVAGVVLLSPTGADAQRTPFEDAVGERVASVEGGGRRVAGRAGLRATPTVEITTDANLPTNDVFTIDVVFSENVTGFALDDVTVTNGRTVSRLTGTDDTYEFDVQPNSNVDGDLTVMIRANAVENSAEEANERESVDFEVDTIEPRFEEATVDGRVLVLEYDENLDEDSDPGARNFEVRVDNVPDFPASVSISRDEVTLTLDDPVEPDDVVRVTYDPPTRSPLQDIAGNDAAELTRQLVTNETQTSSLRPGAPRNLTATADGRTAIDLDWDRPTSDGGRAITGYRIQVSDDGETGWETLESDTERTTTAYTHTGLSAGTTRHYRVYAINSAGRRGPASNVAHATTEGGRPGAPTRLTATASGRDRINLSWRAPTNTGGGITGYRIEYSTNEGDTWRELEANTRSTNTSYSDRGLDAGTRRDYRVSAISSAGAGDPSNVAHATTEIGRPSAPLALSATADGRTRIRLAWSPPSDNGGASITGYRIEVSRTGTSGWILETSNTGRTTRTYTDTNLTPGSRRYYRVAAINSEGYGPFSRTATAVTAAAEPGAPTSLTATKIGQRQINLAWRPPLLDGGARITGYKVEYSTTGGPPWNTLVANTNSVLTTYSDRGLDPATTRHYRVSAVNSVGTGLPSNVANATTDAAAPAAPTGLTATKMGQNQIDLSWTAPTNDGGARITAYKIEYSATGRGSWRSLRSNTGSTATSYSDRGLQPATTRHYRVRAINTAGESPPSNVARATTDPTVPGAPTGLSATANGTSQIDLSWTAPGYNGGSAITGYRVEMAESGNGPWSNLAANTGSAGTTYSHTGLRPASRRYYRVSAINTVGHGRASGVVTATTDATVPNPPTGLVATATAPTQIDLQWTAPEYDGGAAVTSYRVEVSTDGTTWGELVHSTGTTSTTYSHTGLQPGSTRHYRVSAINIAGTGLPSNVANASTDDPRERAGRVNSEVLPRAMAAMTASTVSAISGRIEAVATGVPHGRRANTGLLGFGFSGAPLMGAGGRGAGAIGLGPAGDFGMAQLLDGTSFLLPAGGGSAQEGGLFGGLPNIAMWGSGEYSSLSRSRGGLVDWDGGMLNLHAGADVQLRWDLLVGVAGSRSSGNFDFTDDTGASPVSGTYQSLMTTVNPYAAWFLGTGGVVAWATAGFGRGDVEIEDTREEMRRSATNMLSAAVGASGILVSSGSGTLRVRTEGWMSQVEVAGGEKVDSLSLEMRRARLALEWEQGYRILSGHEVSVILEGGMRYDDGDAGTGEGAELGGGLRYVSPRSRLIVEGRGRVLATGQFGYEEWGASGMIQFDMHRRGEGLSMRLAPVWGEAASGVRQLWDHGVTDRIGVGRTPARTRLDAEVEYGLAGFGGTPYGRMYLADDGDRAFGTGVRYEIGRMLNVRIEGTRRESALNASRHGLMLRGQVKF